MSRLLFTKFIDSNNAKKFSYNKHPHTTSNFLSKALNLFTLCKRDPAYLGLKSWLIHIINEFEYVFGPVFAVRFYQLFAVVTHVLTSDVVRQLTIPVFQTTIRTSLQQHTIWEICKIKLKRTITIDGLFTLIQIRSRIQIWIRNPNPKATLHCTEVFTLHRIRFRFQS